MSHQIRISEKTVRDLAKTFPIVGIAGPKQSGKSTLLKHILSDYKYISFDDERNIARFESDPSAFLESHSHRVIFDEVQRVPRIFEALGNIVRQNPMEMGNYVLTSSVQFWALEASKFLGEHIGYTSLLPFQLAELPKVYRKESIYKGSYPELVLRDYKDSHSWYGSYIDNFLHKDLRDIASIGNIQDFRLFLGLIAAQVTKNLDLTYYAKTIGVSVPTIKRWTSLLEASFILFLVPPFYNTYGKRIVKSPKVYFYDNGLVSYLTGIETYDHYDRGPLANPLFENYIVSEIYKREPHQASFAELYYYRTQDRAEIDLIVDRKNGRDWIEIKKSSTLKNSMLRQINHLKPKSDEGFLIYQGKSEMYQGVQIYSYQDYLGHKD